MTIELEALEAARADVERLRKAIIEIGNMIPGCMLADAVSTDFLMLIPEEVRAWKSAEPERLREAVEAERERCAQAAYKWWDGEPEEGEDLRTAIREQAHG